MKKNILVAILSLTLILSACAARIVRGSGDVVSEMRDVSGFDEVDVCCGMELILSQGDEISLEIEAEDNILAEIESRVVGDSLRIEYRDQYPETGYRPTRPIRIYLTIAEIRAVEISGGGELDAFTIETDSLDLRLSGGSEAEIDSLIAEEFNLHISGGGDASVSGQVVEQNIHLSGGSSYEAGNLESSEAGLDVSGGGDAEVWVTDKLVVNASGGSSISYYGELQLTSNTSGGSTVKSLGSK
ncbi:MAG: DUF2807 domain-containing protein [Anaerolineales bacterium]|nr:DUF2807 domain-containing protein [Chloroflexota bacterium]MBL6982185.1 DUF2807 domain-containing protein [Anaerolineales bacterium]